MPDIFFDDTSCQNFFIVIFLLNLLQCIFSGFFQIFSRKDLYTLNSITYSALQNWSEKVYTFHQLHCLKTYLLSDIHRLLINEVSSFQ